MTVRTYTLTFNKLTLDTSKLRMEKRGGQEVIDYFYLDDTYMIKDDDIVDVVSFRQCLEKDTDTEIISIDGDKTVLKVTLELDPRNDPDTRRPIHQFIQDLSDQLGYESLSSIYRSLYKSTDCGPSIGFEIRGLPEDHKCRKGATWRQGIGSIWLYCDSLRDLGTLEDMQQAGYDIMGISVSSIVEGSDVEIEGVQLMDHDGKLPTLDELWAALGQVNDEASFYWERDNCDWFILKGPEDRSISFQMTWDGVKWHEDDVPTDVRKVVEELSKEGINMTWEGSMGHKTHPYGDYFDVPGLPGWTVCEWLNDATY